LKKNAIVFIDAEIEPSSREVLDLGAVTDNGKEFHSNSLASFGDFLRGSKYACGHNIFKHDLKYIEDNLVSSGIEYFIDTLLLSPLMFPIKPYHHLSKEEKLSEDELNNPLSDAKKARDLFHEEVAAFRVLDNSLQEIYYLLLGQTIEFKDFFRALGFCGNSDKIQTKIQEYFYGKICTNAPLLEIIKKYPIELAYALAQVNFIKYDFITPPWVLKNYPRVENILHFLRNRKCPSCEYCNESLDEIKALQKYFGHPSFRSYDGMPLQQSAARAAVSGKSLLAVFPTGGGKSLTFQLPALMSGVNEKGLTVIISPLQSLMKDQVDTLENRNITDAVTINGSLDPIERAKAFEGVGDGSCSILYISPESLRSKSIEGLLLKRNVVRFVIDEAHCFSSWGQDFRVDYLYIGDFIRSLQEKKDMPQNIPVSCFTATAKQKVIADIKDYFKDKLSLELEVFRASASRSNLSYHIFNEESSDEKYLKLRQLIMDNYCPTIVYVSRTKRTQQLAAKLTEDGYPSLAYHGQMDKNDRMANQDAFMKGEVGIIVATTAFGMGVDKSDVGMVIHYDISDSLENYVQEAGRAGRNEDIEADCFVLFNDEDLNKHFNMLNQTKVSQKEIGQVWKALKELTKQRANISQSALEIARKSGWDDSVHDMETRIKTAINALEQAGFIKRGQNMPRIFADSILVKNMEEARTKIDSSPRFDDSTRAAAIRIIGTLISARSKARGKEDEGEARIDYMSDRLGIVKEDVIRVIGLLREEKILADAKDLVAYIKKGEKTNRSKKILQTHKDIENFLCDYIDDNEKTYNIKEMNEALEAKYPDASINQLNAILNYFAIKRLIKRTKEAHKNFVTLKPYFPSSEMRAKCNKRCRIADTIIDHLYSKVALSGKAEEEAVVGFSVLELKNEFDHNLFNEQAGTDEIEDALYYLLKIGAMKIEGGFLVIYNAMRLERLEKDNAARYKKEHYTKLEEYYQNKRQQIHIVGEYANRMIRDYKEAMEFVDDYFVMNYDMFLHKYFRGRKEEISRNITPKKFKQLFGELSVAQLNIIKDHETDNIVVAAGPGSGKTKLLTHKLASLYMMEDVKHEQMLMLTFSRASATEFKRRLMGLIGNATNFITITTFHSYCFDLLGKVGDLEKSDKIVERTVEKINAGEVDLTRLTKTVLVIDEAQDMSAIEYSFVKTLMEKNDHLRVIAVGDDDQNIYEFRGSSSAHLISLLNEPNSKLYELLDNYRSRANLVEFSNQYAICISKRLKQLPIMPKSKEDGIISVCKLAADNIAVPAANLVLDVKPVGTTCVVVRTNDEALNIVGLLNKNGIAARQIQSTNDFNLFNLVELRDFIADVDKSDEAYAIHDEVWRRAKHNLNKKYDQSVNLRGVLKLIRDFEETNNKTKYKSDFRQFVRESKLEDFVSDSEGVVLVSTIHQTKGREFDNVVLALSTFPKMNDETKRAIYVALTRAKQNLYILYNGTYFDKITVDGLQRFTDNNKYDQPNNITLQLGHEDVQLGYFAFRQKEINSLIAGDELTIREDGLFSNDKLVVKFSGKKEGKVRFIDKLESLKAKGYTMTGAMIRHIIFWQGKEMENEVKIILPDIEFARGGSRLE